MPPELLDAVKGLGIAGGPVFFFLWLFERAERKELQKALLSLGERGFTALEGTKNALDGIRVLFSSQPRRESR